MFNERRIKQLEANQFMLEGRINELQQQFNALTRHLKLNIHKPLSVFQVTEMPTHTGLGLVSGLASPNKLNNPNVENLTSKS